LQSTGRREYVPPTIALDDTDHALLHHLLTWGKSTNRDLAQRLYLSESSVSVRLSKLTAMGLLVVTAVIDWHVAGFERMIICRAKTRDRTPRAVAEELCLFPQANALALSRGTYDLLGYFLVRDRVDQIDLIDKLGAVQGIVDLDVVVATDAAMSAHGYRLFLSRNAAPIRLATPKIGMDSVDTAILQALIDDGRHSSRAVAQRLDLSEITVRARTARLIQSGLVSTVSMIEPVAAGLIGAFAAVSIRADHVKLHAVIEKITATKHVVFSAVCIGIWDLHATVTGATVSEVMETVHTLSAIDGVLEIDTLPVIDVIAMSPYLRRLRPA
jgi:DNA-binding Lrp family transcriptional regulator